MLAVIALGVALVIRQQVRTNEILMAIGLILYNMQDEAQKKRMEEVCTDESKT